MIGHIPVDGVASPAGAAASRHALMPPLVARSTDRESRGSMTHLLPPTCRTGREQREEPHAHAAWARGRDDVVTPIERAGRRRHERLPARAGQPGLERRRDQC
jgi:hypothetical protein